jgi:hypothetical protein
MRKSITVDIGFDLRCETAAEIAVDLIDNFSDANISEILLMALD